MLEIAVVILAGLAAGGINAVVGSGTLVTFPALIALGYPPVVATMSNAIGLVAGGVSGAWGYRREIAAQKRTVLMLLPASALGALTGSFLLLALPDDTFEIVVPVLLVAALGLVVVQPRLQKWVATRRSDAAVAVSPSLVLAVYLVGVYGGYFAAAQGVLLMGVLGVMLAQDLQMSNGLKNLLVGVVNLLAAITYTVVAFDRIAWTVAACIAAGALVGGWLGAKYGRLLSPRVLRTVIVLLGLTALARIVLTG
ncbi:sulfite exporter TauE/SafE family protein [Mycobacterium sp. 236(2023)]|uniref:sulfite exporter TauE/SafE family protein n=1 Tax=Mycobacterium sp. 236(2023) TaxID=3038163 RepID=UPI0024154668|nr:sulfite exporter TauE/SafE family protein [Mycobacterium sp. 236(2023)]MDG4663774.1 sulfite exporter TauE/SafE family protein [Mycobacterium sp. 236(2023)]